MAIIGVDIGGHHIAAARVNDACDALVEGSYQHVETDRKASRDTILTAWAATLNALSAQDGAAIHGIGIAMPGPFDYAAGIGHFVANDKFEALAGVDVRRELTTLLTRPVPIRFINDATAFAVGCTRLIEGARTGRTVALTLGTGLGSAFLEGGIPLTDVDEPSVPQHGCLWHLAYRDGMADDYVSSRRLLRRAREAGFGDLGGVAQLAEIGRADPAARALFDEYGADLGRIVAPWLSRFGAHAIVLGGRITGAYDLFRDALGEEIARHGASADISIHQNTEDAAIIGAGVTFDEMFWAQVEPRLPTR